MKHRSHVVLLGFVVIFAGVSCTYFPDHCNPEDGECNLDPAMARSEENHCFYEPAPDELLCTATLDVGGEPQTFPIRWLIDRPTVGPPSFGQVCTEMSSSWVEDSSYPATVLIHGAGDQDFGRYDYLLEHLALNGFITFSVSTETINPANGEFQNTGTSEQRRQILMDFLDCLRAHPSFQAVRDHWNGDLALVGHSRGGEAVVRAARELAETAPADLDLQAVVSLAPDMANEESVVPDGSDDAAECTDSVLDGTHVPAYLVINGSHDGDVGSDGFGFYDRSGTEFAPPPDALTKSMVWIYRGRHNGFVDPPIFTEEVGVLADPESLSDATHHILLKAYANGFLRWHVKDEWHFRDLFSGAARSPRVQEVADNHGDGEVRVYTQYSEGGGARRRVIDNFECPESCGGPGEPQCWEVSTIGDDVTKEGDNSLVAEVRLESNDFEYRDHRTRALFMRWDEEAPFDVPRLHFDVPQGIDDVNGWGDHNRTPGGELNDVRFFTHLSFRVGQVPDALLNTIPDDPLNGDPLAPASLGPIDFNVELEDIYGDTQRVKVSEVGDLYEPLAGEPNPYAGEIAYPVGPLLILNGNPNQQVFAHLQTIRIPMTAFCDVDLTRLKRVSIELDEDTDLLPDETRRFRGFFALDSLELVAEPNWEDGPLNTCPICGNGVVDPGETCDDGNLDDDDSCPNTCYVPPPTGGGGGGGGGEDCALGDPGCPSGPCLMEPFSEAHAAYNRSTFCQSDEYICRPDPSQEGNIPWTCHDCTDPEYSGVGCPCNGDTGIGPVCPAESPQLSCYGFGDPAAISPPDSLGTCWEEIPPGFCEENCATCGKVCTSALGYTPDDGVPTMCVGEECQGQGFWTGGGPFCEPNGYTCHPSGACVEGCFDDCDCPDNLLCIGKTDISWDEEPFIVGTCSPE